MAQAEPYVRHDWLPLIVVGAAGPLFVGAEFLVFPLGLSPSPLDAWELYAHNSPRGVQSVVTLGAVVLGLSLAMALALALTAPRNRTVLGRVSRAMVGLAVFSLLWYVVELSMSFGIGFTLEGLGRDSSRALGGLGVVLTLETIVQLGSVCAAMILGAARLGQRIGSGRELPTSPT